MTIRSIERLGRNVFVGSGSLAGLLLGWTGTGPIFAQPAISNGPAQVAVAAQAPVAPRNYLNKTPIQLPIQINRATVQEIQLYVKEQATGPWVLAEKAAPNQKDFIFRPAKDGEYWFTMVTVDRQGRTTPADVRNEPPGLIVVIDTKPPTVDLTNLGTTPEGQLVQCDVVDANPDSMQLRFSYQAGDKLFRVLEPMIGRSNVFCIPAQAVCTGMVQVSVEDMARNQTTRQEHLTRMKPPRIERGVSQAPVNPLPTAPAEMKMPVGPPPKDLPTTVQTAPAIVPTIPRQVSVPDRQTVPPPARGQRPDGSQGPHWSNEKTTTKESTRFDPLTVTGMTQVKSGGPTIINAAPPPPTPMPMPMKTLPSQRQIVNNPTVQLHYQIENAAPANVAKIEIWLTRDQGQSWQRHGECAGNTNPVELQLAGEGLFGVTLVPSNGRTAAPPPAAGDQPDRWIEVDMTKPAVQINDIQTSHDKGQAIVNIHWTAQDKNMTDGAVELFYAATPQGPWLVIAKGLPTTGQHRWTPPAGIGATVHVQAIARDAAGNSAVCATMEPITIAEPIRPRAVIRTISTGQFGVPR